MTSNQIILDTNCLYNFLNGEELEVDLVGDKKIVISEITEIEVQCNPNLNSIERKLLKEFLKGITIIRLNEKIRDFAIKIRLTTRMKLMDSIIAATAQFIKIAVVTCDGSFESVKNSYCHFITLRRKKITLKNLAIFASGSGSNAERIVEYFADSEHINVKLFLCNNPEAGVIQRAERLNIPLIMFDRPMFKSGEVVRILQENQVDFVILAGFLWLVPKNVVEAFPNRIINIHPALLPKFGGKGMYGHFVHEAVVKNKETESGITIHFVNEHYDEGAIIFQASFPIIPTDTPEDVARKGQILEHQYFPEAIEEVVLGNRQKSESL